MEFGWGVIIVFLGERCVEAADLSWVWCLLQHRLQTCAQRKDVVLTK